MTWSRTTWMTQLILSAMSAFIPCPLLARADLRSTSGSATAGAPSPIEDCRPWAFKDSVTRQRWCLVRTGDHPGWPARLVLVPDEAPSRATSTPSPGMSSSLAVLIARTPVVSANDVLTISEDTPSMKVNVEGVALSNGSAGELISVRLRLSGKIVRARVIARNRARLTCTECEVH